MIGVALVSKTQLDLGAFMPSAQSVTGQNHVQASDRNPGPSRLHDDLVVLRDFAGKDVDLSTAVMSLGFLVAGMAHDIDEIVEYTRGMAHLSSNKVIQHEFRCVLIHGSLDQWRIAVVEGCKAHQLSTARHCFNQIHTLMLSSGLHQLFEGLHSRPSSDGTFLLMGPK